MLKQAPTAVGAVFAAKRMRRLPSAATPCRRIASGVKYPGWGLVKMGTAVSSFIVSMLGARMHYAVPGILARAGRLERFFTDLSVANGWPRWLRTVPPVLRPAAIKRILARVPAGVPVGRITAFNSFGFQYARRRKGARNASEMTRTFLWANRRFGELVCASDWGRADSAFTFNGAGLEILDRARRERLRTVMEQTIAPSAIEQQWLREEQRLHPGWEKPLEDEFAAEFSRREQDEWPLADLILCGSEFVREGIRNCGGPVEKCVVVPYGVEGAGEKAESRKQKAESTWGNAETLKTEMLKSGGRRVAFSVSAFPVLRVLTVGTVGLRKGAPYVLEAAKRLKDKAVFRMVGSIGVTREAEAQLREHLELTGPVPRSEVARHFAWADVFLLPSLCEGSATVTYEALGHGLPVVCTPNTGSVVRDGREGFVVPARDIHAVVGRLEALLADPALLENLSLNANNRAREYTVAEYSRRLLAALPLT